MAAQIVGVVGTDTDAGKTVVTAALVAALRTRGRVAEGIKPVATGVAPGEAGEDATLLARAAQREARDCLLAGFALPRSPLAAPPARPRPLPAHAPVHPLRTRAQPPGS